MEDFKDLRVWEKAYKVTLERIKATAGSKEEMSDNSQLDRPCRLEQTSRRDVGEADTEMRGFLKIARGSANEARSFVLREC